MFLAEYAYRIKIKHTSSRNGDLAHCGARFRAIAGERDTISDMRALGALLFLLGSAATGYATWATYLYKRPRDVLFGALVPVALLTALAGLLVAFVPDFFS